MTDERLRELYAHAMGTRAGCISPGEMLALIQRQGGEQYRLGLLDHVMACAECRREFDLLRAVDEAGQEHTRDARSLRIPRGGVNARHTWRDHSSLLAAAVVLAAFGLGAGIVHQRSIARDSARDAIRGSSQAAGVTSGVALITPAPDATVTSPVRLAWHAVANARRYRVEVLDGTGAVITGTTTKDTAFTVAAGALRAGAAYSWWVRAETAGSESQSAVQRFKLSEPR